VLGSYRGERDAVMVETKCPNCGNVGPMEYCWIFNFVNNTAECVICGKTVDFVDGKGVL